MKTLKTIVRNLILVVMVTTQIVNVSIFLFALLGAKIYVGSHYVTGEEFTLAFAASECLSAALLPVFLNLID